MTIDKNLKIMKLIYNITLIIFISMVSIRSYSQEMAGTKDTVAQEPTATEEAAMNRFDFFASDELLEMTLSFDVREFLGRKVSPKTWMPA